MLKYTFMQRQCIIPVAVSLIDSKVIDETYYLTYSIHHSGASWTGIQRFCFTAQAQRDDTDNGSFLFKTPHHQVQSGHSGDQHPAKGPIVPQPIRLHYHDHQAV